MLINRAVILAIACVAFSSCATSRNSGQPFQVWQNEKGQEVLALDVRFTSGAPLNIKSIGEAAISKDDQGFVSIQVPLTNNSPFRKTANVSWEWKKADGMVARSPLGTYRRAVNIAPRDTMIIRSVSSAPHPKLATLYIHK